MSGSKKPPVKKSTDLPPKSSGKVKGGGIWENDNITLLRNAARRQDPDLSVLARSMDERR